MGPYYYSVCYNWCVASNNTTHDSPIVNTLTGPDLYTGLQWQIPFHGSDLRRGIELKRIPWIFKLFLKLPARHKLNQVFTGREFKLKAPTVIISWSHKIKETDDTEDTCTVSYWKQQSSTRDVGVRDTIKITRVVNPPLEFWTVGCRKLITWWPKEVVTWHKKVVMWFV